jgi:hypothetical protein
MMRILQETEHGVEQHRQEEEEEEVEAKQIDDDSIDEAPPPPAAADDDESPHVARVSAEVVVYVVRRPRHMRRKGRYTPNFLAAGETAPSATTATTAAVKAAAAEEETRTTERDRASAAAIAVAATAVTAVAVAATSRVQPPEAVTAGRDLMTVEYALQRGTLRAARAVRAVVQLKVAQAEVAQRIAEKQVAVLEANLVDIELENSL